MRTVTLPKYYWLIIYWLGANGLVPYLIGLTNILQPTGPHYLKIGAFVVVQLCNLIYFSKSKKLFYVTIGLNIVSFVMLSALSIINGAWSLLLFAI